MSILNRALLELTKQYWETKQSLIGFCASILVMVGLLLLIRDTASFRYLVSSQGREGGLLIYCLWVFCTTATLDVSKSICADIRVGTLAIFAQSRSGLLRLADGRFLSSSIFSLLTVSIIAATLITLGERFPRIDLRDSLILLAVLLQTYALALLMVAIVLRQKNEIAAQLVGLVISVATVIVPIDRIFGDYASVFLVAGPLAMLRIGGSPADLIVLTASTIVWMLAARLFFAKIEKGLKVRGSLLFR